jgi:hypothetical protein
MREFLRVARRLTGTLPEDVSRHGVARACRRDSASRRGRHHDHTLLLQIRAMPCRSILFFRALTAAPIRGPPRKCPRTHSPGEEGDPIVRQGGRHGDGATSGETPEPPSLAKRPQAVLRSPLPRSHKYVLLALLAYARPDLTVYHAQRQLAAELDYSKTYIREILTHLTACQILGVVGTPRQHYATEYVIDLRHLPDDRWASGARAIALRRPMPRARATLVTL